MEGLQLLGELVLLRIEEPKEESGEDAGIILTAPTEGKVDSTSGTVVFRSAQLDENEFPFKVGDTVHFDGYQGKMAPPFKYEGETLKVMQASKLYGFTPAEK